jgi:hypothetical protein
MRRLSLSVLLSLLMTCFGHFAHAMDSRCTALTSLFVGSTTQMVLLGEIHGTTAAPECAGQAIELRAKRNMATVLGLEWPISEQALLNGFVVSPSRSAGQVVLAESRYVANSEDGRASCALLGLLETVRRLHSQGSNISVVAFSDDSSTYGAPRDELMARALIRSVADNPGAGFVVLTGNVHALRTPFQSNSQSLKPMGSFLPPASAQVYSVNLLPASGRAWNCNTNGCGVHAVELTHCISGELQKLAPAAAYDFQLCLGQVDASSPMASCLASAPREVH